MSIIQPRRNKRRYLPSALRYALIAAWGIGLALLVSYVLHYFGY